MSLGDELGDLAAPGLTATPKGWTPAIDFDPATGGVFVTTAQPSGSDPDHHELLAQFDLDPDKWRITNLRRSRWQRYDGEWLEAYRCTFAPHHRSGTLDVDDLLAAVAKYKPPKRTPPTGDTAFVVAYGDLQLGKPDGDGSAGTVRRVLDYTAAAVRVLRDHRACGVRIGHIVLPQLGDCIEGVNSQGGRNLWRTDLTLTEMIRVYRRLLLRIVTTFAPLAEQVTVPVVPGNHDEAVRLGDKMATRYDDSFAIEAASAVQDALAERDDLAHVEFVYPPPDGLTVTVKAADTVLGCAHGHQFGRDPIKWWQGQAHGRKPIGYADVLLAAHLHHLHVQHTGGGRFFVQVPALDGGSTWFEHRTGENAPSGLLTATLHHGTINRLVLL